MFKYRYHIVIASIVLSIILWVSLNLNQIYEIDKSVPIKITINKPYAVSGNIPLNLDVKFRGVGWNLIRLFTTLNLEFNYNLTARKNEQFVILTKEFLDDNMGLTQNLDIIYVYPETLFVKVESYEEKYVKVLPKIFVNCRDGYQVVGKPILEPDSIKIGGAVNLLKNITFLNTSDEVFKNVNAGIIKNISISDSLSNIIWRSQNDVRLRVNVELTAEKEFQNIEIKVPNIPSDRDVLLIPQIISLGLKGGVNQLSAIDISQITAKIDYNAILFDTTGSLTPTLILPEGCSVISIKPEKIQYIIKKKS